MRDFIKRHINIILHVIIFICLVAIVFGIISLVNYNNQVKAQYESSLSQFATDFPTPVLEDTDTTSTTSLTLEEIHSLPMPVSYRLQVTENYEIKEEDNYFYGDDINTEFLIPQWCNISSEELLSSGLEGDQDEYMIYTLTRNTMINGDVCDILYINNPVNLEFVACSVEFENVTLLYNFNY